MSSHRTVSFFGVDNLPLPWELQTMPPPAGFRIPTVSAPPRLKDMLRRYVLPGEQTADVRRESREQRLREYQAIVAGYTNDVQDRMSGLSVVEHDMATDQDTSVTIESGSATPVVVSSSADNRFEFEQRQSSGSPKPAVQDKRSSGKLKRRLYQDANGAQTHSKQASIRKPDIFEISDSDPSEPEPERTYRYGQMDTQSSAIALLTPAIRPTSDVPGSNFPVPDSSKCKTVLLRAPQLQATTKAPAAESTMLSQKRKAMDDGREWVDTGFGRKRIGKRAGGKRVETLLERGKYENRVWFYIKYENEADTSGDVVYQTDLKKQRYVAVMIKAWDKAASKKKHS